MFSFHKPKIYRSNLGCCICKAKSSSSRFTDSTKYENEFERCFRIQEKRFGEICNACVLLVKRWKKLSPENKLTKHWHHVVDARAGPGTKATGNRRLTVSNVGNSSSTSVESSSRRQQKSQQTSNTKPDVLPLSSSQTNNQSSSSMSAAAGGSGTRARTGSFGNKSRNTSEYSATLDELPRRSYMAVESNYQRGLLSLTKQNSTNIPSPFESVIKRFRQRQQQEQLETQRRQLNKQLRRQNSQQLNANGNNGSSSIPSAANASPSKELDTDGCVAPVEERVRSMAKRVKRYSDSIGSMNIDGFRVSTVLDNSIWRKEKVCCGTIFRGLYNEVAIFPKLLKPCEHRLNTSDTTGKIEQEDIARAKRLNNISMSPHKRMASPPPRTTKSGSISSCDSNTSGTGSMEGNQALDDYLIGAMVAKKQAVLPAIVRPNILLGAKRQNLPTSMQRSTKRAKADDQSPDSSSGNSNSHIPLMGNDDDSDDGVNELVLEAEIVSENSDDATSSSIESLASVDGKKSGIVKTAVA